MGASTSDLVLRHEEISELQEMSGFCREDIQKLYKRFVKLDSKGYGSISKDDLLRIPEFAINPLRDRILRIFDFEEQDRINFTQFVKGLAVFNPSAAKEAKMKVAFDMFDVDQDGFISNSELFDALKRVVGHHMDDDELQNLVEITIRDADDDDDGMLSLKEFANALSNSGLEKKITLLPLATRGVPTAM